MTTQLLIQGTSTGPLAAAGNTVAHVGVSNAGTPNTVYAFTGNQDPFDTIGDGDVTEHCAQMLRCAAPPAGVLACLCDHKIAGAVGTVTAAPGGGPLVAVSGTPAHAYQLAVKVTGGGALGLGTFSLALDGGTYAYADSIPDASAGAVIGTVDLTLLDTTTLNTLTLLAHNETDVSNRTTTFASPANPAAVVSQLNAIFVSFGSHMIASLSQGKYLKLASAIKGATSTLTVASGTALTALGIAAATYTGAAATWAIPHTGLTLTFPAGTYVKNTVYTCPVTAPTAPLVDILAACDALYATYLDNPFTIVQIDLLPADGAELRAWQGQLAAKNLEWRTQTPRAYPVIILGSPLGATGAAGIAANDLDVRGAMTGYIDLVTANAHGDCYLLGSKVIGSFRRSAVQELGIRCAGQQLAQDPGNAEFKDQVTGSGALPEISLTSPDGTVKARDENTATVKMGGSEGPGFSVLKTKGDRGVYFVSGVTRAGPTSVFRDLGTLRATYYAAYSISQLLESKENSTVQLQANGKLRPSDAAAINSAWSKVMQGLMVTGTLGAMCSAITVHVDENEIVATTRELTAYFDMQALGQLKNIKGVLSVSALALAAA